MSSADGATGTEGLIKELQAPVEYIDGNPKFPKYDDHRLAAAAALLAAQKRIAELERQLADETKRLGGRRFLMPLSPRISRSVPQPVRQPRAGDSRGYIIWLGTLPCFVTGSDPSDDPHHLMRGTPAGSRGMGLRAADRYALPVCRWIHDAAHASGDDEAMFTELGFDVRALTSELWGLRGDPNRDVLARRLLSRARQAAMLKVPRWSTKLAEIHARHGVAA